MGEGRPAGRVGCTCPLAPALDRGAPGSARECRRGCPPSQALESSLSWTSQPGPRHGDDDSRAPLPSLLPSPPSVKLLVIGDLSVATSPSSLGPSPVCHRATRAQPCRRRIEAPVSRQHCARTRVSEAQASQRQGMVAWKHPPAGHLASTPRPRVLTRCPVITAGSLKLKRSHHSPCTASRPPPPQASLLSGPLLALRPRLRAPIRSRPPPSPLPVPRAAG